MAKGRGAKTKSIERRGAILGGRHETGGCPFGEVIRASANGYLRIIMMDTATFRGWQISAQKQQLDPRRQPTRIAVENDILEDGLAAILKRLREVKPDGTRARSIQG